MPTALLLHGTDGNDTDYFWFADMRAYLTAAGYTVWWPLLPDTANYRLDETLSFLQANARLLEGDTVLIGHSSACPLILSWLERRITPVRQVILVAGFYAPIGHDIPDRMLQAHYDWPRIKANAGEIIMINSDDDPWGCTAEAASHAARNLSVIQITAYGHGHMGSTVYSQPYTCFPLIKRLVPTCTIK